MNDTTAVFHELEIILRFAISQISTSTPRLANSVAVPQVLSSTTMMDL